MDGGGLAGCSQPPIHFSGVKKQLGHRLPIEFVRGVLQDFKVGSLDAATAASHLGVSRTMLYELRHAFPPRSANREPTGGSGAPGSANLTSTTAHSINGGRHLTNNTSCPLTMITPDATLRAASFPPRPLGITSSIFAAPLKSTACRKPSTPMP